MAPELVILIISAASIAFVHTLLGPDHYVPFIAMAKARGWSLPKTLRVVLLCGSGHLVGSVALGILGIVAGIELTWLEWRRIATRVVSPLRNQSKQKKRPQPLFWFSSLGLICSRFEHPRAPNSNWMRHRGLMP